MIIIIILFFDMTAVAANQRMKLFLNHHRVLQNQKEIAMGLIPKDKTNESVQQKHTFRYAPLRPTVSVFTHEKIFTFNAVPTSRAVQKNRLMETFWNKYLLGCPTSSLQSTLLY